MSWKVIKYLQDFDLRLPQPLADWDVFEYWEANRTNSMKITIKG